MLNAIMGYIQQSRAEEAVAALRQMSAAHANVIRDGARQSVPAAEVVPGDIILIDRLCENWDVSKVNTWLFEGRATKSVSLYLEMVFPIKICS